MDLVLWAFGWVLIALGLFGVAVVFIAIAYEDGEDE